LIFLSFTTLRVAFHIEFLKNNMITNAKFMQRCVKEKFKGNCVRRRSFWGWHKGEDGPSDSTQNNMAENKQLVPQFGNNVPKPSEILILPLRRAIFPGFLAATFIRDEKTIQAIIKSTERGAGFLGTFLRKDHSMLDIDATSELLTDINDIYHAGTFVQIQNVIRTQNSLQLFILAHRQIFLKELSETGPPIIGRVRHWDRPIIEQNATIKAYTNEIIAAARELFKVSPLAQEHIQQWLNKFNFTDPYKVADFAASLTTADTDAIQRVLETQDPETRLALSLELLVKERELAKLQKHISDQVEERVSKTQREYMLREQLKSIKKELGEEMDDKTELLAKYNTKIKSFQASLSEQTLHTIQDEMKKLSSLERNSPEFNVTRSYLDWLTCLPWGIFTTDTLNYKKAKNVLDTDHYGLVEVKQRILEFIAVGNLKGTVGGKIICLIGPPGVGKTSIAKSIARALDRKFYRFSVGGMTDIAEVKGHRRTYIGAMPGKPIQCLKTTESCNPLILIDEIDKLGRGYQGDPASALLELLDPNQNTSFLDHYLDVPVDFSNVLFVCTANDESTIPGPLRDRMEIIRLSGYDIPEKVAIASKYLVPKALEQSGLQDTSNITVHFADGALESLIRNYCRESGVRSLEKQIERITRKIAFGVVQERENEEERESEREREREEDEEEREKEKPSSDGCGNWTVTEDNLELYVGKPKYSKTALYEGVSGESYPPGIVMGLGWSPLGGSPIFIETIAIPMTVSQTNSNVSVITGQLGSVMKESVNIAYTYARKLISHKYVDNPFFTTHQLHLHAPEGAVEKDGPSAGIAITTSLISIALNISVYPNLAMTGEISLTGKILPVGGIKEKLLAAATSGAKIVILPVGNRSDVHDLPTYVKKSVAIHFVSNYEEVFKIAFPDQ